MLARTVHRVDDDRQTGRLETAPGKFGALTTGRRRQLLAEHVREAYTGMLEHLPTSQDAGGAATTFLAHPGIVDEVALSVHGLQGLAGARLQGLQVFDDRTQVRCSVQLP